ncbi:MAG: serine/threonine-protein kinase [Luteolibacter sp.]|uniref:serine/threonine protein kinase n=1 Tax=Luteolibacter sp. TaxID=1962973 RepID=UPI003266BF8E
MTPSKQVEALLLESLAGIPEAGERRVFLDWTCRNEPELRERIGRLLSVAGKAELYFDFQPFAPGDEDEAVLPEEDDGESVDIGLRVGKYRLIRRLGDGGCGVVYLAEQEKPVQRHVALKMIRVDLDQEKMLPRFEAERQALALMDHPGIAKVLDAGATATGRPYFVMEWVAGEKITEFCDHHRLGIPQRLELFNKVTRAVQHAHQKGVIHRDLNPSNILVSMHDGTPVPKVIDFGIATGGLMGVDENPLEKYGAVGTPNYMSPEQANSDGNDVDTRSDVFSLGVMLCELVVGSTPFETPSAGHAVSPTAIIDGYPEATLRGVAENRSCPPHRLRALVEGDLEAIVMKCLRHDRKDRYGTTHALTVDVKHHLDNEPISARPGTRRYRLKKLVQRNKLTFSAGAAVFLALAIGFGISTLLYFRESDARREQVRLRQISETARAAEAKLRLRAEAGETCAQAAVEISYGRLEHADQLLSGIPESLVPPSLEVAGSYVKVADWHRLGGRWQQAAERYTTVVVSRTTVDSSDDDKVSFWLIPAVASACAASDWTRYERLRHLSIDRFATTSDPDICRQILRVTLIRPVEGDGLDDIRPFASLEEKLPERGKSSFERYLQAWNCHSLQLWHFRSGNLELADQWGEKSLVIEPQNDVLTPSVKLVMAMTAQKAGRTSLAREILEKTSPGVHRVLTEGVEKHVSPKVSWMDWMLAGTLLSEAESVIGK